MLSLLFSQKLNCVCSGQNVAGSFDGLVKKLKRHVIN